MEQCLSVDLNKNDSVILQKSNKETTLKFSTDFYSQDYYKTQIIYMIKIVNSLYFLLTNYSIKNDTIILMLFAVSFLHKCAVILHNYTTYE